MGINQNHLFEDLEGVKCAIVEKNASQDRIDFLKPLLELNGFNVIVVPSPPAKAAAPAIPAANDATVPSESATVVKEEVSKIPSTFTIGVTDVGFNPTNAIFGRLLKTKDGQVVTLAYWQQKEKVSDPETPYYEKKH
jgi:hypothetical protein